MFNFVVVGIVRDIASSLIEDYNRISRALAPLGNYSFFVVESDSTDTSTNELEKLRSRVDDFDYISLGALSQFEIRTERMAFARNRYLQELKSNPKYKDVTHVIICDFNNLNTRITTDCIAGSLAKNDWDVCTANQTKKYYDIWALRHPIWSPNDCWESLEFQKKFLKVPEIALFVAVQSRMIHIPTTLDLIPVDSAFGGFAIYKKATIANASYSGINKNGRPICEHVPFHESIKNNGWKIVIDPQLINADWVDHTIETKFRSRIRRISKYPIKGIKDKIWPKGVVGKI